ncbi:MAG: adenylosuccinate synthetase, partial [Gammaproteobacteria bacterium]
IDPLRLCVAYESKGTRLTDLPAQRHLLGKVKPVFEDLPGWTEELTGARSLNDLPVNARRYLDRIAELCGIPLAMIGVGAAREATIVLRNPFRE